MKQVLQQVANQLGYRISKIRPSVELPYIDVLDLVLQNYMQQNQDLFFVQIGANDGKTADPVTELIHKHRLRGLLVEPQPSMFKRLVENYRDHPQLDFENSLIAAQNGTANFYAIRDDGQYQLPMWCYQIASLDRDKMLDLLSGQKQDLHLPGDIESLVETIPLPALTFQTLLEKHHVNQVDLLVIDTIGYDFEIIKMIPFDVMKPAIINFEHSLLSLDDQKECFAFLAQLGYSLIHVSVDTIAYLHAPSRKAFHTF
ncbi:MAG: FkbM family methyltransferase [Oscillatoriophycideae cyanobacterium NC_groundwater_1537_Pr4_S-0.65um_50_18]|nr:FkbM family methyltransferase [Oscillatoriophycideae cyanobacterium NC_groundwater_1537_Pr4_S-0.65um_50_18]